MNEEHTPNMKLDIALSMAVWAITFGILFLTYAGYPISNDERALFEIASHLERTGQFSPVNPFAGYMEPVAVLLVVPWLWLSRLFHVGRLHAAWITNVFVVATTAGLMYLLVRSLRFTRRTALVTSLLLVLGTTLWPYSQRLFREPIAGMFLLLAVGGPFLVPRPLGVGVAISLAAFLAAVLSRYSSGAAFPAVLWVIVEVSAAGQGKESWRRVGKGALVALSLAFVVLGPVVIFLTQRAQVDFDPVRYLLNDRSAYVSALQGLLTRPQDALIVASHMTLSPGKGMLAYSPPLLLGLIGLIPLWRRNRSLAGGVTFVVLSQVVGYSAQQQHGWWGGLGWGTRYLVPIVPVLLVATAQVVESLLARGRQGMILLGAVLLVSLIPQLAGVLVDIRAYESVLHEHLYTVIGDYYRAMAQVAWDLRYNPILGQWGMVGRKPLTMAWAREGAKEALPLIGVSLLALSVGVGTLYHRHRGFSTAGMPILAMTAGLIPVLAVASLKTLASDPALEITHSERYLKPMVAQLNREARLGDAFILTDPLYADFVLNWLQGPATLYVVQSTAPPLPDNVVGEIDRAMNHNRRLWMMRPLNRWNDDKPGIEMFLLDRAYKVKEANYEDWMRLLLFLVPEGKPVSLRRTVPWANGITLVQASVDGMTPARRDDEIPVFQVHVGDPLMLDLVWRGYVRDLRRWKVFVHIGLPDRPPLLQQDRFPRDGWYLDLPQREEVTVSDRYGFELDLPPGRYWVRVGLYDPETGERVLGPEGDALTAAILDVQ